MDRSPRKIEFSVSHRDDIDGLRAIAVLSVLIYHFHFGIISGGFSGVDVFFVISGFVITNSVISEARAGNFTISDFYARRIKRIFPAYILVILFTSIVSYVCLLPEDFIDYGKSVLSTSLFYSNFYFWKSSGYFEASAHTKPLLHTWSLAVEEQFYIFVPILLYLIYRYGRQRWLSYLLPLTLVSFAVSVGSVFVAPTAGFFLLPTRAWELLTGVLVAAAGQKMPGRIVREGAAALGGILIAVGMITLVEDDPFPGWNALFPCIGTALIIQAGMGASGVGTMPAVNRLLSTRPFVWVGLISYSLYMIHWPVVSLTRYMTLRDPTLAEGCLMLAASIAMAWLSWRFIERPFRRIDRNRRNIVLIGGVVVMAGGLVLGEAIVLTRGLPGRFPDFSMRHIPAVEDWGGAECFNQDATRPISWNPGKCTRIYGENGRILLWGDSFAAQYVPGILRDSSRINADVLQYTFAGCPPILSYFSYARVGCSVSNRRIPDIIRQQRIDTVVLSARWTDVPKLALEHLGDTVSELRSLGVRVYVLGQSPEFSTDVQHIDYISGSRMAPGDAKWMVLFDPSFNDRLRVLASSQAIFIDPLKMLCDGVQCTYRHGKDFYYSDYGHFSTAGSLRAVQKYFPAGDRAKGPAKNIGFRRK